MTTRQGSRRGRRPSGSRKKTTWWNDGIVPTTIAVAGLSIFDLFPTSPGGLPAALQAGATVLRLILREKLTVGVINTEIFGASGITVLPRAGIATPPDPLVDLVDWYWQRHWSLRSATLGEEPVGEYTIDLRTARKIRGEDRTIAWILRNSSASGGSVTISQSVRMLLQ